MYLIATVGATSQGANEAEKMRACFIHLCLYAKNLTLSMHVSKKFFFALFVIKIRSLSLEFFSVIHDIKTARREGNCKVSFSLWSDLQTESHCYN